MKKQKSKEDNRLDKSKAPPNNASSPFNPPALASLESTAPPMPTKATKPPTGPSLKTSPPAMMAGIPPIKQPESGKESQNKAPATPVKIAPAPSTAPANLSTPSSAQKRGMLGMFKGFFGKSEEDNAVKADLGGKMEAYYDKEKKRWIFPDDDPAAEDPTAGPPPTAAQLQKSPVKEEKKEPLDPLAAMMAPPSRAPRSAIPSRRPQMPNGGPGMPPKVAVFTPKTK